MKKLGKYEILEEIGRGGFAVVYKARDTTLDRVVALKVLHPQLTIDPKFVQRFHQEARTAASFQHSHIVTIYEVGEEAGQHYLAMAYLSGWTLDRLLTGRQMSVEGAVSILEQIAEALDAIHQKGFVHRDVKPSNIMVDKTGRATLLDFGIVRAAEGTRLTTTMAVLGTPEYMSPELAEGEEPDARSDIYSLGVVAYQMFTGQAPFSAPSPLAVLRFHADKEPPSPRELNPDLSTEIEQVLLKALAKRREDRFQSAGEMVRVLKEAVEAEKKTPLLEPRPTVREPRRRPGLQPAKPIPWRWIAAAGLLVSALIVIVLVVTGGGGEDAEHTDTPAPVAPVITPSTDTPRGTATPKPTDTVTRPTDTPEPTVTATSQPTDTPEPTVTATSQPTDTPEPTVTATSQPTDTPTPTNTATPTSSPPVARISNPATDSGPSDNQYAYDDYDSTHRLWYTDVVLEGVAADPDDGSLSGSSLVWTTDRTDIQDAKLGTGTSVTARLYSDVCTGVWHEITLTATDSDGKIGTAVRRIRIWTLC